MRTALVLGVILALAISVPADGKPKPHRMSFGFAVMVAQDHWAKQDVAIPCKPTRRLLSREEASALDAKLGFGADMAVYPGTCQVLISPVADSYRRDRVAKLQWLYCSDVVHEVGHIAGFDHNDGGIMDPAKRGEIVPWGCDHPRRFLQARSVFRTGF